MTRAEKIRQLCKDNGISVPKLEKDLGYSNGSLMKRDGIGIKYQRLLEIARYFNISPLDLLNPDEIKPIDDDEHYYSDATVQMAQDIFENKELKLLFDAARDADPEDIKAVHNMLLALKRKEYPNE